MKQGGPAMALFFIMIDGVDKNEIVFFRSCAKNYSDQDARDEK